MFNLIGLREPLRVGNLCGRLGPGLATEELQQALEIAIKEP